MKPLNTWGGKYFGYSEKDDLWSYEGKHIGKFYGEEVYGKDGKYLGELKDGKLITNISKKNLRKNPFTLFPSKAGLVPLTNLVGLAMIVGHEDFPPPDGF